MNTMLSEIHAADCSAFVLQMFGPHGQPGAIDLDGDDQISFHEFWQAIQADHPKGMNNMMVRNFSLFWTILFLVLTDL